MLCTFDGLATRYEWACYRYGYRFCIGHIVRPKSKQDGGIRKELCLPANSGKLVINRRSEEDGSGMIGHHGQCCIAIGISVNVVPNGVEYSHAMFIFDKLETA